MDGPLCRRRIRIGLAIRSLIGHRDVQCLDLATTGAGNDYIQGAASDNQGSPGLIGGAGNDWLNGNAGHDWLEGGDGSDFLSGGPGYDLLYGGAGNDFLAVYAVNAAQLVPFLDPDGINTTSTPGQIVDTQSEWQTYAAQWGWVATTHYNQTSGRIEVGATFYSSPASYNLPDRAEESFWLSYNLPTPDTQGDALFGGEGNDVLWGYLGNDALHGEAGNDFVIGAEGDDVITGGDGDDTLIGSLGDDFISGGPDTLTAAGNDNDTIYGEEGNDVLTGGAGNDYIEGDYANPNLTLDRHGQDRLDGGAGDDRLFGQGNDDVLDGGAGADEIQGGAGADVLFGGVGDLLADEPAGVQGDDYLDGGSGGDTLMGDDGNDTLTGGTGNDTYLVNLGDGHDSLTDSAGTIFFGPGIAPPSATRPMVFQTPSGGNQVLANGPYQIRYSATDSVTIQPGSTIESFVFEGHGRYTLSELIKAQGPVQVVALDPDFNVIQGSDEDEYIQGNLGTDIINAGGGHDFLVGKILPKIGTKVPLHFSAGLGNVLWRRAA